MSAASALLKKNEKLDLETLFTHPDYFGITTATPMQRAICRLSSGKPLQELGLLPEVRRALNCDPALLPKRPPKELAIMSGVRVGKSLLAAAHAIYWSQVCDVSKLGPGEVPRVAILAFSKDTAKPLLNHVVGYLKTAPKLKSLLVKETLEGAIVRHPSGRDVEITVVAGAKAGGSLVARWLAGCIFDEWPRLDGADDAVVNYEDSKASVEHRLLDGTQIMSIGSPWAPHGPAYEMVKERWGHPGEDLVLVKAPAWEVNPIWWTAKRVKAAEGTDSYITDCLGEFMNPEASLLTEPEISAAVGGRTAVALPYRQGFSYRAAMDPATRGNGWTLVVVTRNGTLRQVVGAWEWRGLPQAPLSPRKVLSEIAAILHTYNIRNIDTDQYSIDALRDLAADFDISLVQTDLKAEESIERYLGLKTLFQEKLLEIPSTPNLRSDLLRIAKRPTSRGITIHLPKTPDKRHCDFAPSMILALGDWIKDFQAPPPTQGTEEWNKLKAAKMKQERFDEVKRRIQQEKKFGVRFH